MSLGEMAKELEWEMPNIRAYRNMLEENAKWFAEEALRARKTIVDSEEMDEKDAEKVREVLRHMEEASSAMRRNVFALRRAKNRILSNCERFNVDIYELD